MTAMMLPEAISNSLAALDGSGNPLDEHAVRQAIIDAAPDAATLTDAERRAVSAELFAFEAFGQNHQASSWGTHFGPIATGTTKDGRFWQTPEPSMADAAFVEHWATRATLVMHPVLQARYADLAWDLARLIGKMPVGADALLAIDAYLASTELSMRDSMHPRLSAAIRALDLALMIKDNGRAGAARARLLALHAEAVANDGGLWWIAPTRLLRDARAGLTDSERDGLVAGLEALVVSFGNINDKARFNPHAQEQAADILHKQYARQKAPAEQRRLAETVARTFEQAADTVDLLVAPAFLQNSVTGFRNAGMREESERVRVKMQEAIRASHGAMKTIGGKFEIKAEDMKAFIGSVVVEDPGTTLAQIAGQFLASRSALEKQLRETAEAAPLQAMISISITQDDYVAATIGSLQDDPTGRLIHHADWYFNFSDVWLAEALDAAIEHHVLTAGHFTGWANRHDIFDDLEYLYEGFEAWFAQDYVKALHVLVPQVEKGLRGIAGKLGHPVTKPAPATSNASVPINMSDILTNEKIADVLGEDIVLHFRALYSDPRGMNLRNRVAHGSFAPKLIGPHILRMVVHSLMVLGAWRELAEARKKTNGA